jgi:hypothetical protein
VTPWRQFGHVPSLKANGAMTSSRESADVGADVLGDADELGADRTRLERRFAAVEPEVRAAHTGRHDADDRVRRLDDHRIRAFAGGDGAGLVEDRSTHGDH